jgi:hypothetical protein
MGDIMKKTIIAVALITLIAANSHAALIDWNGTFASGTDTFAYDGVTLESGWYIAMYQGSSLTVDVNNLNTGKLSYSTEVGIQGPPLPAPGQYVRLNPLSTLSVGNNSFVYTVLFDNADYTIADNYVVLDSAAFNVGNDVNPIGYTPNGDGSGNIVSNGSWQAIPEPATALMLAVGGGLAFIIRRKDCMIF